MSLSTWITEFYTDLHSGEELQNMTMQHCVEHSLKKWRGLSKDNLERHGVVQNKFRLYDPDENRTQFPINSYTCSLCVKYYGSFRASGCEDCPIYLTSGKTCMEGGFDGPYVVWEFTGDAEPMIRLLEDTLDYVNRNHLV